ncbi:MAG: AprM [Microgenomates group bacterium GW2011_GWF2_47_9]|nr:MAG: AprM [Microgenomates group bacterium GW2011_GWF2_47_9]
MIIGVDCSRALVSERTGTENYSYSVIKEMLRLPEAKKHKFVLYVRPNVIIPDFLKLKWVTVREIPYKFLFTQLGLARELYKEEVDVLWIPAHTLPILRPKGLKTVVTIHGLEYKWLPEYKNLLQRWYLPLSTKYAARSADRVISVSHFTKGQLVAEFGILPGKIKVIHEGFTRYTGERLSAKKVLGKYGIGGRYILFVGSLQPRKNIASLIAAFGELPGDTQLVISGNQGWMDGDIYQALGKSPCPERIIFTGRVSDQELAELYRGASLYVQPSITEGFGLPILEAMGWGIPVVSSDGGALPEVVGEAGIVVPLGPLFSDRLVRAMERALMKSTAQRLVKRGLVRVRKFTWKKVAKETLSMLVS